MDMVSGGRSLLNPNAPLFIPTGTRTVEELSDTEWLELVQSSTWLREYWMKQQEGRVKISEVEEPSHDDILNRLPETLDLVVDEDIAKIEAHWAYEEEKEWRFSCFNKEKTSSSFHYPGVNLWGSMVGGRGQEMEKKEQQQQQQYHHWMGYNHGGVHGMQQGRVG